MSELHKGMSREGIDVALQYERPINVEIFFNGEELVRWPDTSYALRD